VTVEIPNSVEPKYRVTIENGGGSLASGSRANTCRRPTQRALCLALLAERTAGRWGFCGIFEYFSGFEFFLFLSIIHARPPASNANRWAA